MDCSIPQTADNTASLVEKTVVTRLEEQLNEGSFIQYDQKAEKDNSEFQVKWTNIMAEGKHLSSSSYTDVAVLLISWVDGNDDLKVKKEVDQLEEVFTNTFNYRCDRVLLKSDERQASQVQINFLVSRFIYENDSPTTLLMIYYAGHGVPGEIQGDLQLSGNRIPSEVYSEDRNSQNKVVWNHTETLLYGTKADIVQIFDCCYADSLAVVRGEPKRFEYLAATHETTKSPGKNSFTSALIWALKTLAEEKDYHRFTLCDVVYQIKHHAPKFPRDQMPVLSQRGNPVNRERIVLAPLPKRDLPLKPGDEADNAGNSDCGNPATQVHLTLKFIWEKYPAIGGIEQLARQLNSTVNELNSTMHQDHSRICRIDWGGLRAPAAQVASTWKSITRQRNRNSYLHLTSPSAVLSSDQNTLFDPSLTPATPTLDGSICATPINISVPEFAQPHMGYHLRMIWREICSSANALGIGSWRNTRRFLVFTSLGAGVGFSWIIFKSLHRRR